MASKTQETPSPSANKVREWGFSPALMEKEKTKGKKFSVIATLLSQSHMTCLETAPTLLRKSHAMSNVTSVSLAGCPGSTGHVEGSSLLRRDHSIDQTQLWREQRLANS